MKKDHNNDVTSERGKTATIDLGIKPEVLCLVCEFSIFIKDYGELIYIY